MNALPVGKWMSRYKIKVTIVLSIQNSYKPSTWTE